MSLRAAEEELAAEESAAGAGRATAKDTERAAGVFIAQTVPAGDKIIPMGGIVQRTECIGRLQRRGKYLHWRSRQVSSTLPT